ncbi:MAG: hypothetical protein K1X75_14405 [Leptospirales bacterium]|nr:hypothetical protein [Leptospirales bacterium]
MIRQTLLALLFLSLPSLALVRWQAPEWSGRAGAMTEERVKKHLAELHALLGDWAARQSQLLRSGPRR